MITTLKVILLYGAYYQNEWSANIEIDESSTLEQLHCAILKAVNFENDHLYYFYISRTDSSRDRIMFDDENGLNFTSEIKDLFPLPKRQSLFYLFDWGDHWLFKKSRTRKSPYEPVKGISYPRVESESGTKPEQYPDYDGAEYEDQ